MNLGGCVSYYWKTIDYYKMFWRCVCVWRVEGKVAFDVLKIVFLHPFFYNQEIQYK